MELAPRIRILDPDPTSPPPRVTFTPATVPVRSDSTDSGPTASTSSPSTVPMALPRVRTRCSPGVPVTIRDSRGIALGSQDNHDRAIRVHGPKPWLVADATDLQRNRAGGDSGRNGDRQLE